jgi:RND superfamily putative drug exporter
MKSLALFAVRRRWYVLVLWIVLFVGMNIVSSSMGSAYKNDFTLPDTNSILATKLLQSGFPAKSGDTDQIVFHATSETLANDKAAINQMLAKVAKLPQVASVVSPFCDNVANQCPGAFQINKDGCIW